MKITAAASALAAGMGLAAAQPTCPGIAVSSMVPKSTRPGAKTTYQLKITNSGATTVSGLTLMAHLPGNSEYMSAKAFPRLTSGDPNPLVDGTALHWSGISVAPRKTQTLKLAVAISSCALDTAVFNANITGANDCVVMAPRVHTTLKRSSKDKPCAPTPAPTMGPINTCNIDTGLVTDNGLPLYQCAFGGDGDWYMGTSTSFPASSTVDALDCANQCLAANILNVGSSRDYTTGACNCYQPRIQDAVGGCNYQPNYKVYVAGRDYNPEFICEA